MGEEVTDINEILSVINNIQVNKWKLCKTGYFWKGQEQEDANLSIQKHMRKIKPNQLKLDFQLYLYLCVSSFRS